MGVWAILGVLALLGGCRAANEVGSRQPASTIVASGTTMVARPQAGGAPRPAEQLILSQHLSDIPFGALASTPIFSYGDVPVHASRIRVELTGPVCGTSVQQVNIGTEPDQLDLEPMIADGNGVYETSATDIYEIELDLYQDTVSPTADCDLDIYAPIGPSDGGALDALPPDAGPSGYDVLAGWVTYDGGFVPSIDVPITATAPVLWFRVEVPSFCQVDIAKADVITQQAVAPIDEVDTTKHQYLVNDGYGAVISAVTLTLNGPTSAKCELPVFITTDQP